MALSIINYQLSKHHNHQTTPLESLSAGLSWYLNDYPDLSFYSVQDIKDFGGIEAVQQYYQARGSRYNMSTETGKQAKFSMFRYAAEEKNWSYFSKLERHLGAFELSDDASAGWFHFFLAIFSLKTEQMKKQKPS